MKRIILLTTTLLLTSVVTAPAVADMVSYEYDKVYYIVDRSKIWAVLVDVPGRINITLNLQLPQPLAWAINCKSRTASNAKAIKRFSKYLDKERHIDLEEIASKVGFSECTKPFLQPK